MSDLTKHKYYCSLGKKVCGNFKRMGHSCKVSCRKELYDQINVDVDHVDCDYPFKCEDFSDREFINFMVNSGFIR